MKAKAKFGSHVIVARCSVIAESKIAGEVTHSKGESHTIVPPVIIGWMNEQIRPRSWKSGSQLAVMSEAERPVRAFCEAQCRIIISWVSITRFWRPVVPEECWSAMSAPGSATIFAGVG